MARNCFSASNIFSHLISKEAEDGVELLGGGEVVVGRRACLFDQVAEGVVVVAVSDPQCRAR